jgi:hypothetical protein
LTGAVRLPFCLDGLEGVLSIQVERNSDPAWVGSSEGSVGLPVCTARVELAGCGYRAMCGWIQLVRSSDNSSGGVEFELDPFGPFTDMAPTLFDAPARVVRDDLDWTAHAWLARTELGSRVVEPVVGFSWGFTIREREPVPSSVAALARTDWARHVPLLQRRHPGWVIAAGV